MIKVTPMDDELAIGHEGRIAWINAVADQRAFDRLMTASSTQIGSATVDRPSRLSQLAAHAEMSPTDYARKHSMLPAFRVAAKHGEDLAHGDVQGESFNRRLGMLTQKKGAYICQVCVAEDLKKRHLSWYRRAHHLVGVDWCPIHQVTLFRIAAANPWAAFPHHWIEDGEIESVSRLDLVDRDMAFLGRYEQIATALLDRSLPLDIRVLGHLIAKRAQDLGLRKSLNGQRSTISDHIWMNTPNAWLKSHFSQFEKKEKASYITKIDNALISRTVPAQGNVYPLALASLFDSSDEALEYLDSCVPAGIVERVKTPMRRTTAFWNGEFWEIYVKHGGLAVRIAESLGMDRTYLIEKMCALGMPSLHNVGAFKAWRALIRLHNGEGFRRSCEIENADEKELEDLLRVVNPKVVALASRILGNANKGAAVAAANMPALHSACEVVDAQKSLTLPNQQSNPLFDTVVADQETTWQAPENMMAA